MIFSPSKSSCCQNPPREPGSEQTRRGGGCVCWLPSANSGSCSCHSVTATCPGPGAAPRAPWPPASAWPPPSAMLGVSSRAAQCIPKPGSKLLCHQGGETEAGGGQEESSERLCPAGLCGVWVLWVWGHVLVVFPKSKLSLPEPTGLVRMRVGVAEAMLTVCSTPGWLIPALTTFPVT